MSRTLEWTEHIHVNTAGTTCSQRCPQPELLDHADAYHSAVTALRGSNQQMPSFLLCFRACLVSGIHCCCATVDASPTRTLLNLLLDFVDSQITPHHYRVCRESLTYQGRICGPIRLPDCVSSPVLCWTYECYFLGDGAEPGLRRTRGDTSIESPGHTMLRCLLFMNQPT